MTPKHYHTPVCPNHEHIKNINKAYVWQIFWVLKSMDVDFFNETKLGTEKYL